MGPGNGEPPENGGGAASKRPLRDFQISSNQPRTSTANRAGLQQDRYPFAPGHKDTGTGRDAAIAYAPQAGTRRAQVLAGLAAGPASAEEIGERIGLHWYLTRPRLSELQALGLVAKTGERGRGALGGAVNLWRLTTAAERAVSHAGSGGPEKMGPQQ